MFLLQRLIVAINYWTTTRCCYALTHCVNVTLHVKERCAVSFAVMDNQITLIKLVS